MRPASFNELNPAAGCDGCRHVRYFECYSRRKCALVPDGEPVDIWIATQQGWPCGPDLAMYEKRIPQLKEE